MAVAVREGTNEVWAAGEGGVVLRSLNGGITWEGWGAAGGVSKTLRGIWAAPSPSQRVVAVGDDGAILHYDGSAWSKVVSPPAAGVTLNAVFGSTESNIVAVGDNGTILRYRGTGWLAESSNTTVALRGVWGTGDVFIAVGDQVGSQGHPAILKSEAGQWKPKKSAVAALHAVWGVDANRVFAAGRRELNNSEVFWSEDGGESWSSMNPPTAPTFLGIWGGADNLFAAGEDGKLYRCVGASCGWGITTPTQLTVNDKNPLKAVTGFASGSSLGKVIAVGAGGVIARFDGATWAEASQAVTRADLHGVWGTVDGTTVYAVGEQGSGGEALRCVGNKWASLKTFGSGLRDVWGPNTGNDVYMVGKMGRIEHYLASVPGWQTEISTEAKDLAAVSGTPDGKEVYAVGADGTALSRSGASNWARLGGTLVPGVPSLTGVWAAGNNEVVATSGSPSVFRWWNGSWKSEEPVPHVLHGVWGSSPSHVFTVGLGIALRDASWKEEVNPVGLLHRVWGDGSIVVAVGERGTALSGIALRQATGGWIAMSAGTSATLRGVWGTKLASGKSLFYAVGPAGAILRREQ